MSARVLLLEREEQLRTDYRNALEADGYQVRTVTDAEGALAVIGEDWPDVAVLNLTIPGIDGMELLWEIANLDRPVPLIMSALPATRTEEVVAWVAEGFARTTPDFPRLKERISRVLTRESQPIPPAVA